MTKNTSGTLFGANALRQLYRGQVQPGRPLVFLDIDDVLCLNAPYGGYDLFLTPADQLPGDFYQQLWHPPAAATLRTLVEEFAPRVVVTSSWLRLFPREGFDRLFRNTGLETVADALHPGGDAEPLRQETRLRAIERWLHRHYQGEPLVVLDDDYSGSGLKGSKLDKAGRVLLCEVKVGLHEGHLPFVRQALSGPR